jgi:hypothetical protein
MGGRVAASVKRAVGGEKAGAVVDDECAGAGVAVSMKAPLAIR